jgi:agmatine deiminase
MNPECFQASYLADTISTRHARVARIVKESFTQSGISVRYIKNTADIWCRDYMPVVVSPTKQVKFVYEPDYLKKHPKLKTKWKDISSQFPNSKVIESDIVLDGGNVTFYKSYAFITSRVFKENSRRSRPDLLKELESLLEKQVIIIPEEPWDPVGHIDGMMRPLNGTLIRNSYASQDTHLETQITGILGDMKIDYVNLPDIEVLTDNPWDARGNYVNFTTVKNTTLVPCFGNSRDQDVLKILRQVAPEHTITLINCNSLAKEGGLLQCITWETPD